MENYILNMAKDYGKICKMSGQWMKTYWVGYLAITAFFGALSYVRCARILNR